ncbi:hypothetical protein ACXR0M_12520 [Pseudomonas sp. Eth.TT006]
MTTHETLEALYAHLIEGSSNPRQKESLARIKKAADYLEEQRMKISPTAIERYCIDRDWGGPKAQSIRNSQALSHYVKARTSGQTLRIQKRVGDKKPLIPDETIRAYVQLLEDERDQAIASRVRIEAGLRKLPGIPIDELIRVGFGGVPNPNAMPEPQIHIPPAAREAIAILFNEVALNNVGLQLHKDRVRQNVTLNVLLHKHHMVALRSLILSPGVNSDAIEAEETIFPKGD